MENIKEEKGVRMVNSFEHPIIGQEAICPDGVGRVIEFKDEFPIQWIKVKTYVNDRGCKWDPLNVDLIAIGGTTRPKVPVETIKDIIDKWASISKTIKHGFKEAIVPLEKTN